MAFEFNKLVRDRIPEIIAAEGRACYVETMSPEEYRLALLTKLTEEAAEIASAPIEKLAIELADLQEVMDAVLIAFDVDPKTVRRIQDQRRRERGGFEKRLKLIGTS